VDKFQQSTTDQLYFRDPDVDPPPRGASMLLLNPGNVCVIGVWDDTCIGWLALMQLAGPQKWAQAKLNAEMMMYLRENKL